MSKLIKVEKLNKVYDQKIVLKDISFTIKPNEFVTILGPSGCGKTTLLRIIGGFEAQDSGVVYLNGEVMDGIPANAREVNTVFQKYSLFPHMNVFDNIAFGLKLKKLSKEDMKEKVSDVLKLVDLKGFEKRQVESLSGGEQQRVAIARALVMEPKVLLLDEPLSALDRKLRQNMQMQLKHIQEKAKITFIYVTHDQEEALTMSNRIIVLNDGEIQQIGKPQDIYDEPENVFVAKFVGSSNILDGVMIEDLKVSFLGQEFECVDKGFGENNPVNVVIRPEDFDVSETGKIHAKIIEIVFKGIFFEITAIASSTKIIVQSTKKFKVGDEIRLDIIPFNIHVIGKE